MLLAALLVTLGSFLTQHTVTAASCWRDTACTGPAQQSFPGTWDKYNYSPASRTVSPVKILNSDGSFLSNFPGPAQLNGNGSLLIFDFGQEVGGIVTVAYSASESGTLALAFSEAKNWTGYWSDNSNGAHNGFYGHPDGYLSVSINNTQEANYTIPDSKLRGGFRYLSLFVEGNGTQVDILDVTLELAFQPAWSNLRAYGGYFYSNDDLINRIWYAGAYTLQTNSIPAGTGRRLEGTGWDNDEELDLGTTDPTIYIDGSKRDRTVWAGDLAIAVPSILVSTGDSDGVKNTLQVLYNDQASTGELPFAGPALNIYGSDTYHMATMIGTYDYYLFTKDDAFLSGIWAKYEAALSFIRNKIDSTGMLDVTGDNDWGRLQQGGHNTEANMLIYQVLITASSLATWVNATDLASGLLSTAATLKAAINSNLYDVSAGAFKDSDTDGSIHPQDGNSMALLFNATDSNYTQSISQQLTTNWISIGAVAPELPDNLIGFGQSFEIKGHLAAHQPTRALDLIRSAWGWYLNNPSGTSSTFIEGYLSDGTFGYRANDGYDDDYAYTSHAHGWSTGPTDALTSYILGLRLTSPGGSTWVLEPQFGDLTHVEGGFTTPLGRFGANWTTFQGGYSIQWSFPGGTVGTVILPGQEGAPLTVSDANGREMGTQYGATDGVVVLEGQGSTGSLKVTY